MVHQAALFSFQMYFDTNIDVAIIISNNLHGQHCSTKDITNLSYITLKNKIK